MRYKVNKETGCWEFTGCKTIGGYGRIRVKGVHWMAHRYFLSQALGRPIAEGMLVLHSCDNPCCVNPAHLREGTQKENVAECIAKGRARKHTGPRAKKREERKAMIIQRHREGWTATAIAKHHKLSVAWVKQVIQDHVSA